MSEIILRTSIVLRAKQTTVGDKILIEIDDRPLDCAIKYLDCLQRLKSTMIEGEKR